MTQLERAPSTLARRSPTLPGPPYTEVGKGMTANPHRAGPHMTYEGIWIYIPLIHTYISLKKS